MIYDLSNSNCCDLECPISIASFFRIRGATRSPSASAELVAKASHGEVHGQLAEVYKEIHTIRNIH